MGDRYCAINSPLGPRWGQKSLDLRSRDFCPHLEPRGELIAQYRPPMSFRYNITQACDMVKSSNWNMFLVKLAICVENSPVPGEFPPQKTVTRSFDVFLDLRLNKRLSKQSRGWWFETPLRPLYHRNVCRSAWLCYWYLPLTYPDYNIKLAWHVLP